jgi:hypothetical protein
MSNASPAKSGNTTSPPPVDLVSKNRIWAEACEKEVANLKLNTNFALGSLSKLDVYSEKPNLLKPVTVPTKTEVDDARALLDELCSVKDAGLLPREKFDIPQTSAQEVGFTFSKLVKTNPMFAHPRSGCAVTRYADSYYETTGVTPFHRKPGAATFTKKWL